MIRRTMTVALAAAAIAGCGAQEGGNNAAPATANAGGDSATGGGQPRGTLAEAAAQTGELSQFSQALQAAGLTETFRGAQPYTVFAPVNAAFERLPQDARTRMMSAEGREQLTQLLTYHVVAGEIGSQDLAQAMERNQGRATLSSIAGQNLVVTREGDAFVVTDAAGGRARIVQADRRSANGVLHQIDAVLMPGTGTAAAQ